MRRLAETDLNIWKDRHNRKPLIIRGARQVGKSFSVEKLGEQFAELVVVNLELDQGLHGIFEGDLHANRIIEDLRSIKRAELRPGASLLFLDEIQSCPRAITALRYFYEQLPELHVVAAGSLLDFALGENSFPVGRVEFLPMYPMTFVEFLWATGHDRAAELALRTPEEVSEPVHKMILERLRDFFFVGGMPESVRTWVETGSTRECLRVQGNICESLRRDFGKYAARSDPRCLDAVLLSIAREVGRQIMYTRLAEGFSGPTIKKAFDLLCAAQVVTRVQSASAAGLPLGASASAKRFKAIMVDIGLMQSLRGFPDRAEYLSGDLLSLHEGAMAEQFVGQEMLAAQGQLHYWSRNAPSSSAEVDYLTAIDGKVVPVEVKSGSAGRLRSMHAVLGKYPDCPHGIVFSARPYSELPEQKLIFVPLYHAYATAHSRDLRGGRAQGSTTGR